MSQTISRDEVAHRRLANQQIAVRPSATAAEVVAALGAMQAQDDRGAQWAIGLRLAEATEAGILAAIEARTIVRTWLLRGTLHYVAGPDLGWMLELVAPRVVARAAYRQRQLDIDDQTLLRAADLLSEELQGGARLTRAEIFAVLERGGVATTGQRGIHVLWSLAFRGLLCFATPRERQPTFTLLADWLRPEASLDRPAALAELARRYFTSHGPASLRDFVWWSGLTVVDARAALAAVMPSLTRQTIDGTDLWMPDEDDRPTPGSTTDGQPAGGGAVHLLPGFDEYILGYTDRSAAMSAEILKRIVPGGNGMFLASVVAGSRVVGTWKSKRKKASVTVSETLFEPLSDAQYGALRLAARRYAHFIGLPLSDC